MASKEAPAPEAPEQTEYRDNSPLGAEPPPRRKPPRAKKPEAPAAPQQTQQLPLEDELPVFEDDSPLDALAEAATALCEVSREGPGTGRGWVGRLFDYEDGRGPQAVHYGRIGTFPRARGLLERVEAEAGGGYFKFATKGHPVAFETLKGPPVEIPSALGGFPNGAQPNARGGFERGNPQWSDEQGAPDPFEDPNFDPSVGVDPEAFVAQGVTGWYRGGPYNRLIYYVNGQPSRPPRGSRPPAALLGGASSGVMDFDPSAFDHSGGDRIARLEKLVEKLVEAPREDPRLARLERLLEERKGPDAMATMMANQLQMQTNAMTEASKQRDHEFKMAELRQKNEESERKTKAIADASANVELKKLELAAIQAKADADKTIALENAKSVQANAAASISSNERIAQIQADANKQVLQAMTSAANKNDGVEILTKGMQLSADLMGGKGTVGEIANAAEKLIPSIVDGFVAVKTMNSGNGQSGPAPGSQSAGESDDGMISRFVGLIATLHAKGTPPAEVPKLIGAACIVSGFDASKLDPLIALGTPAAISAFLESSANKATDETNKRKMLQAKEALSSEQGKAWFASVRQAFQQARKTPAQVSATPSAGQLSGPGPSTPTVK